MTPFPKPLETLGVIGHQSVAVTDALSHHELATWEGMLTLLWHGPSDAAHVVLMCGGALGGVLGPGRGGYHDLGNLFAQEHGFGSIRVGYRAPNELEHCTHDVLAAAELASSAGAHDFVVIGHSFGGAVALQTAAALGDRCRGVVTVATQSAGCEAGEVLEGRVPVLLLHGDADTILPYMASQMVHMLTGGELVIIPGADHRFADHGTELRERLSAWVPARFA